MTKINIISGFLGAGKTTFIKRLIEDVFRGEKLLLIENEFGEIGVDGGFLQDAGVQINEMISGCICCSLVGDFTEALREAVADYAPDRILIEPSGVGKLSDVIAAVEGTGNPEITVDACITVVDCLKAKMYRKNFGEFYEDQIRHARCVLLTRVDKASEEKIAAAVEIVRDLSPEANIITTALPLLGRDQLLDAFRCGVMADELLAEALHAHHEHEHHHEHHDEHCDCHEHHHHDEHCDCHEHHHHDEHCDCHEHHHHDEHCDCHEHHHHDEHCDCHEHHHHDEHCDCHEHHHHDEHCDCHEHHHHDEHCDCHEHHHEHHHEHGEHCTCGCHGHHHADEAFTSWGFETARKYTAAEVEFILSALEDEKLGQVLRAKGMVDSAEGWIYFDYVPGEADVRRGSPCFTGKVCVIGADLNEDALAVLFHRA